ncbi:MAG: endonuclease/exonuclease/phosphatase family protein [Planctomycetaceae bacterium]
MSMLPASRPWDAVLVASFNIQVFGETKVSKPQVVEILARIVRRFDVVAIQEVRSKSDSVIPDFVRAVNADGSLPLADRASRGAHGEQGAVLLHLRHQPDRGRRRLDRRGARSVRQAPSPAHARPLPHPRDPRIDGLHLLARRHPHRPRRGAAGDRRPGRRLHRHALAAARRGRRDPPRRSQRRSAAVRAAGKTAGRRLGRLGRDHQHPPHEDLRQHRLRPLRHGRVPGPLGGARHAEHLRTAAGGRARGVGPQPGVGRLPPLRGAASGAAVRGGRRDGRRRPRHPLTTACSPRSRGPRGSRMAKKRGAVPEATAPRRFERV